MTRVEPPYPHVISCNLARPATLDHNGRMVRTGIFKEPVDEPVVLEPGGVRGDLIADLRVHGGPKQAVYAFPSEHYPWWAAKLGRASLPWGALGENLTTVGIVENAVHIGDRFRIGRALVKATKPRLPCFKLAAKLGTNDVLRWMRESSTFGIYFAVLESGEVRAGDPIECVFSDPDAMTIRTKGDAS
jgi:MOSC domain-containing protein YiiM